MAPAESKLRAEAGVGALPRQALAQYLRLLRLYPVLTKAATSGFLSALGNFLAQVIEKKRNKKSCSEKLDVSGPLRYAIYGFVWFSYGIAEVGVAIFLGLRELRMDESPEPEVRLGDSKSLKVDNSLKDGQFFFTGPLSHFSYLFMERWVPPEVPWAGVKRLLLDRVLFAPAFLLSFFVIMNFLEGRDAAALASRVRSRFWPALQMNWRVWTPVQFINVNYVPLQFRVLFANLVALFWYIYLASLGK